MKRYGPVGSRYNSKRYLALHNRNISIGLRNYWFRRKANEAYRKGEATPEQLEYIRRQQKVEFITWGIFFGVVVLIAALG